MTARQAATFMLYFSNQLTRLLKRSYDLEPLPKSMDYQGKILCIEYFAPVSDVKSKSSPSYYLDSEEHTLT